MCTVLLPPGDNPIAVNKYIISYHIIKNVAFLYGCFLEAVCAEIGGSVCVGLMGSCGR
jgi:hypothetical protein